MRLSFGQAVRWALLWPACVVMLTAIAAFLALRPAASWSVGFNVETTSATRASILFLLGVLAVLFGPPAVFLVLWKVARP